MARVIDIGFVGILVCGGAFAQPSSAPLRFEIADVHVSAEAAARMRSSLSRGGQYELRSATMLDLIRTGYGVEQDRILGGPRWLETDRFDVVAEAPAGAGEETLRTMLRSLLVDRFELVVHNDTKPLPAYVLKAGGKPSLKTANNEGDAGCKLEAPSASLQEGAIRANILGVQTVLGADRTIHLFCRNVTMAAFAEAIPGLPAVNLGNHPVLDRTGLKGAWNFDFRWTFAPNLLLADQGGSISIFDAIEKQLGLKLETEPVPTPVIVVDRVNQKPTANPPGVARAFPAVPAPEKFEVAAIKPVDSGFGPPRFEIQPGGQLSVRRMTLSALVNRALAGGDAVVGLPDWTGGERFDITAKAPPAAAALGPETVKTMLLALLVERFKLATHAEKRAVPVYQLVAVHPKMKKADPEGRTRCANEPPAPGMPLTLSRLIRCQNTTMAQFADQLRGLASSSIIDLPVVDATRLAGAWDFTVAFSPAQRMSPAAAAGDSDDSPEASDPNGAVSIFSALKKQLGLELRAGKRIMPVIVVDRLEKKPTDN
jgi:uncharacterized protein (TIGR03435 family)